MELTTLVFSDGTRISSGPDSAVAIRSAQLRRSVNADTELTLGSVCAGVLEVELIAPEGTFTPETGAEVTLYRGQEQQGIFLLETPTRVSPYILRLTAYDRVSLLDRDLTQWLSGLAGWPYRLQKFAWLVCAQCGLELENETIPNGDYAVEKFTATQITGRQLLRWAAEAAGCYCVATAQGRLRFDWYTPGAAPGWYFADSLRFENYAVAPIDRVQICRDATDVGIIYPPEATGNTYRVLGNFLLTGQEGLPALAQNLFARLAPMTYTPCTVTVEAEGSYLGQLLTLTDGAGTQLPMLVMSETVSQGRATLSCTGSPSRESVTARNRQSYRALTGRVLQLQTQVEGLSVENRDAQENAASLALAVEGIRAQVQQQSGQLQQLTRLEQTAESLSVQLQSLQTQGVDRLETETGFLFDKEGLRIRQSGSEVYSCLDHRGLQVLRDGQPLLQADVNGVLATDVQVRNYLLVGDNARFENYGSDRTACYYT